MTTSTQRSPFALNTQQVMALLLFVLLFAMAVRIPVDTDTWWHLRSGESILAQGRVPLTDPFSLTRFNQPWIDHSWGSQIVMWLFYRWLGGNVGLALYMALLATGGMYFVYRMCEGNVYLKALVIIIAAAAAAVFWSPRPQMMSFCLSTVVLYILHLYKRKGVDRLWLLLPIMVLWANLHAGFFIGFLILAAAIVGETLGRLFGSDKRVYRSAPNEAPQLTPPAEILTWRQIGKLTGMTLLAYALLIFNPNTVQLWTYSFRTVGIGVLQQYIQEWNSPNFHGRETWPFVMLLIGTFAAVGLGSRRLDWTDLALVSGFAFLSLYAGRNISTFAVVTAPVLARHADSLLRERGLVLPRSRPARGPALAINYLLLVLVSTGALVYMAYTLNPVLVAKEQDRLLPVKAAAYLNEKTPPGPLFNSYNWGGYLMFAAPQYRVFVDGRTDLYDDELLTQWLDTTFARNWQKTFEQWDIRLAVIEKDSALAVALRQDANWQEVYQDHMAAIFQRKGS